ncbi:MAG: hypothetical protein NVS9B4_13940 [Candidatus Acidiferrum sp.]
MVQLAYAWSHVSRLTWRYLLPALSIIFCVALFAAERPKAAPEARRTASASPDQPPPDTIGSIDGDAIAVSGPMGAQTVDGQILTMLRSGSDIRVKSGTARINLAGGGTIEICGPAHVSVLKSGGTLTVVLDKGSLHAHIERDPALTVYTPQILIQPVAIGDAARDTFVAYDAAGAMCIRATRGAVRLEQQLTGQNILLPQGGDIQLANGQLDAARSSAIQCSCDFIAAKTSEPKTEISRLATTEEVQKEKAQREADAARHNVPAKNIAAAEPKSKLAESRPEPIYKVYVPPLIYDAKAKVQPDIDPRMIVLVRKIRVRPTLIFEGRVEGDAPIANAASAAGASVTQPKATAPTPAATTGTPVAGSVTFIDRIRNFMRSLWGHRS